MRGDWGDLRFIVIGAREKNLMLQGRSTSSDLMSGLTFEALAACYSSSATRQ